MRYWSPSHFLPAQLALENASVERFIDISYLERINPATQLAIFDNCKLADLNKNEKKIRELLLKVALVFYVPTPSPDVGAREAVARLGLNDPTMCPFLCITDQDLRPGASKASTRARAYARVRFRNGRQLHGQ